MTNGQDGAPVPLVHFRKSTHPKVAAEEKEGVYEAYTMPHPVWSEEELYSVEIEHTPPEKGVDRVYITCNHIHVCYIKWEWEVAEYYVCSLILRLYIIVYRNTASFC